MVCTIVLMLASIWDATITGNDTLGHVVGGMIGLTLGLVLLRLTIWRRR